jgi:hypothetical protein
VRSRPSANYRIPPPVLDEPGGRSHSDAEVGLHRLVDDRQQLGGQGIQVDLLAQRAPNSSIVLAAP